MIFSLICRSGLDSSAALSVCKILKRITSLGVTVVAILHQPRNEIFFQLDDLLLIAPGGRTAYLGPANKAQEYFTSLGHEFPLTSNPADILMDILTQDRTLADKWENRAGSQEITKQESFGKSKEVLFDEKIPN
jgi:ABC-type multidrug transport system ATPase subunit